MTITHTAEYGYQELQSYDETLGKIYDVPNPDPDWTLLVSAFFDERDGHCFHMRYDPPEYRWEQIDYGNLPVNVDASPRGHYIERPARFIDACCRPCCTLEETR